MKKLHRAAAVRAYRTLATGLGGSAISTALVALATEGEGAIPAAVGALTAVVLSAFGSFWRGVAAGLPEVDDSTTPAA